MTLNHEYTARARSGGGQGGQDRVHCALAQLGVGEQAAGGVGDVEDVDRLGAERLDAGGLDVQAAVAEGTADAPQQAGLVVRADLDDGGAVGRVVDQRDLGRRGRGGVR